MGSISSGPQNPRRSRLTRNLSAIRSALFEVLEGRRLLNADIIVNTDQDVTAVDSNTSLREAIALAVATPGDDNITFDASVFPTGSGTIIALGTDGALVVPASADKITITGLGADTVEVSGEGTTRVLDVNSGANVSISGITIANGLTTDSPGGGILNNGTLALSNVSVINNTAMGSDGPDGDAQNPGQDGKTASGGAVYNTGTLSISNSNVDGNIVIAGAGGSGAVGGGAGGVARGGAIFSAGGTLTLTDVTLTNNTASGGGGGTGPEFGLNGGAAYGGAVYADSGTALTISGGSFTFNFADAGSGADIEIIAAGGGDGGEASGGGLYFGGGSGNTASVTNTDFSENNADAGSGGSAGATGVDGKGGLAKGGAIYFLGALNLSGGQITDNVAAGGQSPTGAAGEGEGGAIFASGDLTVADAAHFESNTALGGDSSGGTAGDGGGGAVYAEAALHVQATTFVSNIAQGGAGLTAGGATGGAILSSPSGSLDITTTTFATNAATSGEGQDSPDIGHDGAAAHGGALAIIDAGATITDTTFDSNTVTGGKGGNGADGNGGVGGQALGGAIYTTGNLGIGNSTVYGNTATGGTGGDGSMDGGNGGLAGGGGIYSEAATFNVLNVTITQNQAISAVGGASSGSGNPGLNGDANGGGILAATPATLINTLIADNRAETAGADLHGQFVLVNSLTTTPDTGAGYTLLAGSTDNQLDVADAKLGALDDNGGPTRTVLPEAGSPAIDHGDDAAAASLSFDQRGPGFDRKKGDHVDIGAVETEAVITPPDNTIHINFQPLGAPIPSGYFADTGNTFASRGNGQTYGWDKYIGNATRDRNLISDQLRDTLVHTQLYGTRTWEIAVPNGAYQVHLVAGDAQYIDSVYKINVEGVLTVNGTPTKANHFVEGTQTVVVTDGKLTVSNAAGSKNNKFDFVDITPVPLSTIRINFQTPNSPTPAGFLADSGATYGTRGNGQTYGWNQPASSFSRDRNNLSSPDQQHDTLIHTQLYGTRTWEIAVPNGQYQVHLVAGDPNFIDSVYKYNVEGVLTVNGTPTAGNHWIEGTMTVTVSDGKLTVGNAVGSKNNKIDFIEITPVA